MCPPKPPKPPKPPPLPAVQDAKTAALRNAQARKQYGSAGSVMSSDVTGGKAGAAPTYTPAAGNSTILGSG